MKFMQRARKLFNRVRADEGGQSTTEYILILLVVVMVASRFRGMFDGVMQRQVRALETQMGSFGNDTE